MLLQSTLVAILQVSSLERAQKRTEHFFSDTTSPDLTGLFNINFTIAQGLPAQRHRFMSDMSNPSCREKDFLLLKKEPCRLFLFGE